MQMRSRRGMTLAEIMVSLALVSIMIVMAVSFVMLVTQRTRANTANDLVRQDCLKIEAGAEGWLNALAKEGASGFSVEQFVEPDEEGVKIDKVLKAGGFELSFSYGTLTGTLPEGEINISTECVKTVLFEVMENDTDFLVFCRIECENTESGKSVFHTFCINPRAGEKGGA